MPLRVVVNEVRVTNATRNAGNRLSKVVPCAVAAIWCKHSDTRRNCSGGYIDKGTGVGTLRTGRSKMPCIGTCGGNGNCGDVARNGICTRADTGHAGCHCRHSHDACSDLLDLFHDDFPFSVKFVSESSRSPGRIVIRLELHDIRSFIPLRTSTAPIASGTRRM